MKAQEFLELLEKCSFQLRFPSFTEIEQPVELSGKHGPIRISNARFKSKVNLQYIECEGLHLENCDFEDDLTLSNIVVKLPASSVTEDSDHLGNIQEEQYGLMLSRCRLEGGLEIHHVVGAGIYIGVREHSQVIDIHSIELPGHSLFLRGANGDILSVRECTFGKVIRLFDCQVNEDVQLESLTVRNLFLAGCTFKKENAFEALSVSRTFVIFDSQFEQQLNLELDNRIDNELKLERSTFRKGCRLNFQLIEMEQEGVGRQNPEPCGSISIIEGNYGTGLYLMGNNMGYHTSTLLKTIFIEATEELTGAIFVYDTRVSWLNLFGFGFRSSLLFFSGVDIQRLKFDQFSNTGSTQFVKCNIHRFEDQRAPELSIRESKPGNLLFQSFNLSACEEVYIINNDLSGFQFVNVSWFNFRILTRNIDETEDKGWKRYWFHIRMLFTNDSGSSRRVEQAGHSREAFKQLKQAAEKQGDRILALKFQQYEMKLFYEELRLTKTVFSQDRFIIWLSRSNNYGQSWLKPVLILLGVTAVFWIVIVRIALPSLSLGEIFTERNEVFILMLNPVHSIDKLLGLKEGANLPDAVWWLDYLHRLMLAYLVFQIVAAFRKYVRS